MLGFIDPNITVNIIDNEKIVNKIKLSLPEKVEGIIKCKNPRCITSTERNIMHRFVLIDEEKGIYKCEYCDQIYSWEGRMEVLIKNCRIVDETKDIQGDIYIKDGRIVEYGQSIHID